MCGREVQRAVGGFVTEAIHQSHLLHLHRTHESGIKALRVNPQKQWKVMLAHFFLHTAKRLWSTVGHHLKRFLKPVNQDLAWLTAHSRRLKRKQRLHGEPPMLVDG